MASNQSFVDFILEQASGAGALRAKKMFGEYAIYLGGPPIALVCDDRLFVKATPVGRALLGAPNEAQPYRNAKPRFMIEEDLLEDRHLLPELFRITDAHLSPLKPKAKPKALPAGKAS
jgi:TfoX/Sxy family transcriptional regulator of competence genes